VNNNINNIIAKYWAGDTSLEEEQALKVYLQSEDIQDKHIDLVPLVSFFSTEHTQRFPGTIDLASMESHAVAQAPTLVTKYLEGNTTLAEEETLKLYFSSDKVKEEHLDLVPLFSFFKDQESIQDAREGDTQTIIDTEHTPKIEEKKEAKVRRMFPRVAAVAASLALLLTFTFTFFNSELEPSKNLAEVEDTEAALEVTMQALAYLGHNYDKGANPMKHIKQLEKTNIFKFN